MGGHTCTRLILFLLVLFVVLLLLLIIVCHWRHSQCDLSHGICGICHCASTRECREQQQRGAAVGQCERSQGGRSRLTGLQACTALQSLLSFILAPCGGTP